MSNRIGTYYKSQLSLLRINKGKSLKEVAEITQIKESALNNWEIGIVEDLDNVKIPYFKIENYCKFLGITYKELKDLINQAYWLRKRGKPEIFVTQKISPLRSLRMKSYIKMEDLTRTLNVTTQNIRDWENGRTKKPRNNIIKQLAIIYNISEEEMSKTFLDTYNMFPENHVTKKPVPKYKVIEVDKENKIMKVTENKKVSEEEIKEYEELLERLYGKISFTDFMTLKSMVENLRS